MPAARPGVAPRPTSPWPAALLLAVVALAACAPPDRTGRGEQAARGQHILLDGQRTRVLWNDGDSFRVLDGPLKETRARLYGYNTLESYGPVHFWGGFHGYQLYDEAKKGKKIAGGHEWVCTRKPSEGGYGRALVDCPELARELVREGLAHVFHVGEGDPDPALVALMIEAQSERRGIWRLGIPAAIVTSVHSTLDRPDAPNAYCRVCDTRTGKSEVIEHHLPFRTCDAWCYGGSCMVYGTFEERYTYGEGRVACMRNKPPNRLVAAPHLGEPLRDGPHGERAPMPPPEPSAVHKAPRTTTVVLDGAEVRVLWDDGDTFTVKEGPRAGLEARLQGYNTLESYGPVHFWGALDGEALYENAAEATAVARSRPWACTTGQGSGGYGRGLVACPALMRELVGRGLAHVFHVGKGSPDPAIVALQREAQEARRGMWSGGIPARIVTSVHPAGEKEGERGYNRVCDTRTGKSWTRPHDARLAPCDAVCDGGSCMVYVPFDQRYQGPHPACMETGHANRVTLPPWLGSPREP